MNSLESLYPPVYNCNALQTQISILKQDIDYFRKRFNRRDADSREKILKEREEYFYVLSCAKEIDYQLQKETKAIFDVKADAAKKRIEFDSYKTRNIMVAFGALVLISGLIVVLKRKK